MRLATLTAACALFLGVPTAISQTVTVGGETTTQTATDLDVLSPAVNSNPMAEARELHEIDAQSRFEREIESFDEPTFEAANDAEVDTAWEFEAAERETEAYVGSNLDADTPTNVGGPLIETGEKIESVRVQQTNDVKPFLQSDTAVEPPVDADIEADTTINGARVKQSVKK